MKITPMVQQPAAQSQPSQAQSAREKAISAFNSATNPVPVDANQVSPEEISAVQAPQSQVSTEADAAATSTEVPVETKPEPKEDSSLTNQYNILARKERALRAKAQQQEQTLKAKEAALAAKEAELAAKEKQYSTDYIPKQRLKSEALSVLAEEGVSYETLTEQILNQQNVNPQVDAHIKRLEAQIQRLEKANEDSQKNYVNAETERYKAAVKQIAADVNTLVKTDPTFETIKATRSTQDVVDLIETHFKETGTVMTVEEACQEVENYLVEEAMKLTRIEKIKKRLATPSATAAPPQKQTPTQSKQPQPMKTLTNAAGSTRQLSARERALLAFKGELGKG